MRRLLDNHTNRGKAAKALSQGDIVAYPTDTLYGLGANVMNIEAVAKVFAAKGRSVTQGMPVLIGSVADLPSVASDIPDSAYAIAGSYWPGPVTLVLQRNPQIPPAGAGGGGTIAVRVPNHPAPLALVREVGAPITGTSANRHGAPDPEDADEVARQIGTHLSIILDGGRCHATVPSTIVDLSTNDPRVLRIGAISLASLMRVIDLPNQSGNGA